MSAKSQAFLGFAVLALVLLLLACGRSEPVATAPSAAKSTAPTTPAAQVPAATEPLVKEVNYDAIFKLQYCNYTIANLDYDVSRAKEEQQDAEEALAKAQEELAGEESGSARSALEEDITTHKATIEQMKAQATDGQAKLADTISKCNTLEKKKDSNICKAFIADAKQQFATAEVNLASEKEDLDQAIANNVQSKILKNQRNVAKAQATLTKMQAILAELEQRCG